MITWVGMSFTFVANGLSYVAVLVCLLLISPDKLVRFSSSKRGSSSVRAGLSYVRRTPHLLAPIMLVAVVGLLAYDWQVLLPLFGTQDLHGDATTVGYLMMALGGGSIIGGLSLAGVLRPSRGRIAFAAGSLGALCVLAGVAPSVPVLLLLVFMIGASSTSFKALGSSWLQLTADQAMRGRVLSLLVVSIAGTGPVGAPLISWLSTELGVRRAIELVGFACLAAAGIALAYLRRDRATVRCVRGLLRGSKRERRALTLRLLPVRQLPVKQVRQRTS